jgi:hypothetical protein
VETWRLEDLRVTYCRVCEVEKRIGTSAVRLGATAVDCECRLGQRRLM